MVSQRLFMPVSQGRVSDMPLSTRFSVLAVGVVHRVLPVGG